MFSKTALISIHPEHVAKILSGEKRLEFRRVWATRPLDRLLIYSTNPEKKLVAVAEIKRLVSGTPNTLWKCAEKLGGGITRVQLFDYLNGRKTGIALELSKVKRLRADVFPPAIFGVRFRAPQSFRYLSKGEEEKLDRLL